jgi:hypothetical protein
MQSLHGCLTAQLTQQTGAEAGTNPLFLQASCRRSSGLSWPRQARCRRARCCIRRPEHKQCAADRHGGQDAHVNDVKRQHVSIRKAGSSAELRAAAHLRVASFYSYPLDRSEFSARVGVNPVAQRCANHPHVFLVLLTNTRSYCNGFHDVRLYSAWVMRVVWLQSHRRMKTNAEWEALEQKLAGTRHDWQVQGVRC